MYKITLVDKRKAHMNFCLGKMLVFISRHRVNARSYALQNYEIISFKGLPVIPGLKR